MIKCPYGDCNFCLYCCRRFTRSCLAIVKASAIEPEGAGALKDPHPPTLVTETLTQQPTFWRQDMPCQPVELMEDQKGATPSMAVNDEAGNLRSNSWNPLPLGGGRMSIRDISVKFGAILIWRNIHQVWRLIWRYMRQVWRLIW